MVAFDQPTQLSIVNLCDASSLDLFPQEATLSVDPRVKLQFMGITTVSFLKVAHDVCGESSEDLY